MNYDEQLALLTWHESQQKWHKRRRGKWHEQQARWHAKQLRKRLTISFIVSHTMKKHMPQLAANISANNSILRRLIGNNIIRPA